MSKKRLYMLAMTIGSILGGYVPIWLGADSLSFASLIGSAVGGLSGIFLVYRVMDKL